MAFLDRLSQVYAHSDLSAFEGYLVPDAGLDANVKVVLLCESPHVEELESSPHRPLSGRSGRSVAKVLAALNVGTAPDNHLPIGELVAQRCPELAWLGLMNACPMPMQEKAYEESVLRQHREVLDDLRGVRAQKHSLEQSALACAIRDDLAERWSALEEVADSAPLLIACGEIARRFRDLAGLPGENLPKTPHPSYGQWDMALELLKTVDQIEQQLELPTGREVADARSGRNTSGNQVRQLGARNETPADTAQRLRDMRAIAERCASRLAPGSPAVAHGDLLYDERGLPR